MYTFNTHSSKHAARRATAVRHVLATLAIAVVAIPHVASAQTWSPWLNRDKPSGKGDYETIAGFKADGKMPCAAPTAIECRFAGPPHTPITTGHPKGYTCNTTEGGYCVNTAAVKCGDMEVRFLCQPPPPAVTSVGDTTNCSPSVVVGGMHYPSQSCAQSQSAFVSTALTSYHLTSKCPAGQPLKGVANIGCLDAPIPGFSTGSVYTATACCTAPTPTIANLPMQGGNENTPCPQLGVTLQRSASTSVSYFGIMLPNLDQQCASKGAGFKLTAIKFLTCAPDARGVGFGPNAKADIFCGL